MSSDGSSTTSDDPTSTAATTPSLPKIECRLARPQDELGTETVVFEFLNEGAANAVFCIRANLMQQAPCFTFVRDGRTIPLSKILGKVLRISKGKPKTLRCDEIVAGFEKEIKPMFRPRSPGNTSEERGVMLPGGRQDPYALLPSVSFENFLMDHELVYLSKDVMTALLHVQYGPNEIPAAPLNEQRGLLLPDMSPTPGMSLTLELKPKWLAPSPNAPKSSYRCRTCALHAKRLANTDLDPPPYLCPLQLVAGNKDLITRLVKNKISQHADGHTPLVMETVTDRAVDYLTAGPGHDLLLHLRRLQTQLDPKGVLWEPEREDIDQCTHRLRLAMTLRDCSLFLRIPYVCHKAPIEAKLVDLDFKSGDKVEDWYKKEVHLRNGGWYTNLDAGVDHCWIADGWREHVPRYM